MHPFLEYHVRNKNYAFAWNWNFKFCVPRLMAFAMVICEPLFKKDTNRWTLKKNKQCWVTLVPRISTIIFIQTNHSERKHKEKKHVWFQPESQLIVFAKAFQLSDSVLAAWLKDGLWQPSKVGYSQHPKSNKSVGLSQSVVWVSMVFWTKRFLTERKWRI